MSEKAPQISFEKKSTEVLEAAPTHEAKPAPHEKEAEKQAERHDHSIDKLQKSIHEKAISGKDITIEQHHPDTQPVLGTQRELKAAAYQRTIDKIQTKLNPAERSLSKVVHQPLVESVSEVGSKTIARPSGILGGGIISLLGSGVVLYMAKHYGFEYSYFIFIALFLAGFFVGSAIELLVRATIKR
jgi:hypothetical protein